MDNLLTNPGFGGTTFQHQNAPELTIPTGWMPFWRQGTAQETAEGYWKRPEYKPEPYRRRPGSSKGHKWFTTYATHDAGLMQTAKVTKGEVYTFKAWAQYWSEHDDKSGGGYALTIGIDPYGKVEPFGNSVLWAPWIGQEMSWPKGDTWRELTVTATAMADQITVYLRGACRWRARHNDSYWDETSLELTGAPPVPEPPPDPEEPNPDPEWTMELAAIHERLTSIETQIAQIRSHFA